MKWEKEISKKSAKVQFASRILEKFSMGPKIFTESYAKSQIEAQIMKYLSEAPNLKILKQKTLKTTKVQDKHSINDDIQESIKNLDFAKTFSKYLNDQRKLAQPAPVYNLIPPVAELIESIKFYTPDPKE